MDEGAVQAYISRQFGPQIFWYETQTRAFEKRVVIWTWVGIVFGFLATALAAFPVSLAVHCCLLADADDINALLKWVLVVLTAVASIATGMLIPRYRQMAIDREKGRVKTTLLAKTAEINLMYMPMTSVQRGQTLLKYARELMAVEDEHGSERAVGKADEVSLP
jgi:hypothetical protein